VREAGFSDFLPKPIERNTLKAGLARWPLHQSPTRISMGSG